MARLLCGMPGLEIPLQLPDLWQQEAVRALRSGRDVIVDAPTGAGKTRVFEMLMDGAAPMPGGAVYTVPTRALANDKWREWKSLGWNVGIATGDVAKYLNAPVIVATLETQRERFLAGRFPGLLVVDEYQMLADARRGLSYEMALALPPPSTRLLLLSGSVKNPQDVAQWLERLGRHVELVRVGERPVPLDELPVRNLPRVPESVRGFWPRVAAAAIAGGVEPLLIFAPRRREAEKIARQIAGSLSPVPGLAVSPAGQQALGGDLSRLLEKGVAFHHSGLPYEARSAWVEDLGKSGRLRVIVATTGLAAGINFSVRSVMVASVKYSEGAFQRELRPDELLQMFGRAGRRGLDDRGFVLSAEDMPRLFDASPRQIRRINQIDWPTLLRVMESAAEAGTDPLARAEEVCRRLFSVQKVSLGFDGDGSPADDASHVQKRLGPVREEFFSLDGRWHPAASATEGIALAKDCLLLHKGHWIPALKSAELVNSLGPGRLCKWGKGRDAVYGKEVAVGKRAADGRWTPNKWAASRLKSRESFTREEFSALVPGLLASEWAPACAVDIVEHGDQLMVRLDVGGHPLTALKIPSGESLLRAPVRKVVAANETSYTRAGGEVYHPPRGSAAYAWRRLGLLDASGKPTERGRIVSRFQAGEGLVIAAALEDEGYPLEDIVRHLANLRGGHRFSDFSDGESLQLSVVARKTYGHVDFEGYLEAGLCPGFGEGTWEALLAYRSGGMRAIAASTDELSRGDIERAILEWQSLLRHILHSSDPGTPRWTDLREAAASALAVAEAWR
jgi:superfamily II DNA/RNA helicase